ncbi:type II toxin-antitoxin system RelE/ParE family toxin [Sphingosinicella sp.]|uniref:type II toxin-antitoxin system RelE/ParE family toxin n=1 Tax=Sphingosinicella sp. TaxID=1917971 RepID=UPI0040377A0D
MMEVRQTAVFRAWFARLRDIRAQAQIVRRIERAQMGNLGDVKALGDGVSEMRIHHGAGYRLYLAQHGGRLVVLLCGGDKASQAADIRKAKAMAKDANDDA